MFECLNDRLEIFFVVFLGRVSDPADMNWHDAKTRKARRTVDQIAQTTVEMDQVPVGPFGLVNRGSDSVDPSQMSIDELKRRFCIDHFMGMPERINDLSLSLEDFRQIACMA